MMDKIYKLEFYNTLFKFIKPITLKKTFEISHELYISIQSLK